MESGGRRTYRRMGRLRFYSSFFKEAREAIYLFGLLGLRAGVLPGLSLLSRRRWSGLPVDLAIGFGPGLSAINTLLEEPH